MEVEAQKNSSITSDLEITKLDIIDIILNFKKSQCRILADRVDCE